MEKEISSGSMLGIVLIAFGAVLGLGLGVFTIATGIANPSNLDNQRVYFCLSLFFLCISILGVGIWLKYKNLKNNIWDNIGNEYKNILTDCDKAIYNEVVNVSKLNDISFLTAIRCRLSRVRKIEAINFERYLIKEIKGTVKIDGNFFIIGDKKLSRGLILLNEGEVVNFKIKTFLNLETALGIYRIYDIIA